MRYWFIGILPSVTWWLKACNCSEILSVITCLYEQSISLHTIGAGTNGNRADSDGRRIFILYPAGGIASECFSVYIIIIAKKKCIGTSAGSHFWKGFRFVSIPGNRVGIECNILVIVIGYSLRA